MELHAQTGIIAIFDDQTKSKVGLALSAGKISVMTREEFSSGSFLIQSEESSYLFLAESTAAANMWIKKLDEVRQVFINEEDRRRLSSSHPA